MTRTNDQAAKAAHEEIEPDVRDLHWISNCAGEIFVDDGSEQGVRIGHFQGDAKIAAFVVAAHAQMLAASETAIPNA